MDTLDFIKMHGLGNDFVILDGRHQAVLVDWLNDRQQAGLISKLADRRCGIGFDQLLLLTDAATANPDAAEAEIGLQIFNSDGSHAAACGNGTRCVAEMVLGQSGGHSLSIATIAGKLTAERLDNGMISVCMGKARLDWQSIPLTHQADTMALDIGAEVAAIAVNIGNPHAVLLVDDAETVDIARLGPGLERHPVFADGANIEWVHLLGPDRLRMRVWERGSGITRACGSGACAAAIAAARAGISGRQAEVVLDGGSLMIRWDEDDLVHMQGPASRVFSGRLKLDDLMAEQ